MPNPDYSPPLYSSDLENSDGSFDQEVSEEDFAQEYSKFHRSVGSDAMPTVGFGSSTYGVHPSDVTVARTGPGAGRPLVYRTDDQPLYRFDGRTPDQIRAAGGFRPSSDELPVSLQPHQNTTQRSALVSFTRDPHPSDEMLDRTDALSRAHDPSRSEDAPIYRYEVSTPGGYDVTASLGRQSYPEQQEVAFYKGVKESHIVNYTPYGLDAAGEPVQTGPTAPYVQRPPGHSQSQVAWAANLGSPGREGSPSRQPENISSPNHSSPQISQVHRKRGRS